MYAGRECRTQAEGVWGMEPQLQFSYKPETSSVPIKRVNNWINGDIHFFEESTLPPHTAVFSLSEQHRYS